MQYPLYHASHTLHVWVQVMGCAASYAEQYSDTAVVAAAAVAKLTRNIFLAAVVPLMAVRHSGAGGGLPAIRSLPFAARCSLLTPHSSLLSIHY